MTKFHCTVAVPTKGLFSGEIDYAEVPGVEGSFGVLAGHEMFMGQNCPGILTLWLDPEGKEKREFAIYKGFTQVFENNMTVLGRMGREVKDIDPEYVRGRLEETRAEIAELEKQGDDVHKAILETHRVKLGWYEFQMSLIEGK